MYYVAAAMGFLVVKNTARGPSKTMFATDIRYATPFATYEEADKIAHERIGVVWEATKMSHYAILNTNHAPSVASGHTVEHAAAKKHIWTLYWRDGVREVVKGPNIKAAFATAGYGDSAIRALDFYAEGDDHKYTFDTLNNDWVKHAT